MPAGKHLQLDVANDLMLLNSQLWIGLPWGLSGKEPACSAGDAGVQSLGWQDPPEEGTATRPVLSPLPWTEEPDVGYSPKSGSQRVGHN